MKIFDENMKEIIEPDLTIGYLEDSHKSVTHRYIIDVEEITHEEVIAEYPNGGKDVEYVVDVEEQGHWETVDENGESIDFDGFIPDDMPKEQEISDTWGFYIYKLYTKEQLDELEKAKQEAEAEMAKAEEREEFLESAPNRIDTIEAANDDIVLMIAELIGA